MKKLALLFLFLMVFTLLLGCVQYESPKEENKTTEVTVDSGNITIVETKEPEIKENEDLPPSFPE
ncbi:hypothetical protein HYT84_01760 [Candidatus Micrarchaeota archaeon]|nr:hypothetical protein [Candidatus Micrarchaeota archaeon]